MAKRKMTVDELKESILAERQEMKKHYEIAIDARVVDDKLTMERARKNHRNARARLMRLQRKLDMLYASQRMAAEYVGPWIAPGGGTCDTVEDAEAARHLAEDLAPEAPEPPFRR